MSRHLSVGRDGLQRNSHGFWGERLRLGFWRLCGEERPATAHAVCVGRFWVPMRSNGMPQPPQMTFLLLFPLCCRDPGLGGVWPASQSHAGPPSPAAASGAAPAPARLPLLPPLPGHPQEPRLTSAPRRAIRGAASAPCSGQVRCPAVHGMERERKACP